MFDIRICAECGKSVSDIIHDRANGIGHKFVKHTVWRSTKRSSKFAIIGIVIITVFMAIAYIKSLTP